MKREPRENMPGINVEGKEGTKPAFQELFEKYGEKLVILSEEDHNLPLKMIMEKYGLATGTSWRLLTRGWAVRGLKNKTYMPDKPWAEANAERIVKIAEKAYRDAARMYPDIFPPFRSVREGPPGFWADDFIQEAVLEIIGKSGSPSLIKELELAEEIEGVKKTRKSQARDFDAYLFGVARRAIIDKSKLRSGDKGKWGAEKQLQEDIPYKEFRE